jgi:hypothetical protein
VRRFAQWYAIVIGVGMLGMWTMFFVSGSVPEVRTAPIALAFHLAAEAATALTLIAAGIGVARDATWAKPVYLVGSGLLLYSVVVSPGYFAQQGQWPFVGMFAAFAVGAAVSIRAVLAEPS